MGDWTRRTAANSGAFESGKKPWRRVKRESRLKGGEGERSEGERRRRAERGGGGGE